MAHAVPLTDDSAQEARSTSNGVTPGTTSPESVERMQHIPITSPRAFDGPIVLGRQTTVTCFSPPQLVGSPLLPSFHSIVNNAYAHSHRVTGFRLGDNSRFSYDGQFLDELGNGPGTFTFIIHYTGTNEVVGTASAKRHVNRAHINERDSTFFRLAHIPNDTDAWELSTMAVNPELQRQGLAGYLMNLTEDELKRRLKSEFPQGMAKRPKMVLTTIKEINAPFYERRGYVEDYEIWYDKGHLGAERGFHILFMSKALDMT